MLLTWLLDKIGFIPKITVETDISTWPFPIEEKTVKKQANKVIAKKPSAKKVVRKSVRKKA